MTVSKDFGEKFASALKEMPIIAILRGVSPETVAESAGAIQRAGINLVEVTLDTPGALQSIEILCGIYRDNEHVFIGAGTVLTPEAVASVAKAGAGYVISPNTAPAVIRETKKLGLLSVPGFYTPSEAFIAIESGADYLKCFPVRNLGPAGLKDLKAVVSKPIIAVGGVNAEELVDYLKVAAGVGMGSNLYAPKKNPGELYRAAEALVAKVRQMRKDS